MKFRWLIYLLPGICLAAAFASAGEAVSELDLQLIRAAEHDDAAAVQRLLREGANPRATRRGFMPADIAFEVGAYNAARVLVRVTPETNRINRDRRLSEAIDAGNSAVVDQLAGSHLGYQRLQQMLRQAAIAGHPKVVDVILSKDPHLTMGTVDSAGFSALLLASIYNSPEIVQTLITRGELVNQPNPDGVTPLIAASDLGHSEVVRILIGAGADVNARDGLGRTPLGMARLHGHRDVIDMLVNAQATELNRLPERPAPRHAQPRRDRLAPMTVAFTRFTNDDTYYLSSVAAEDFSWQVQEQVMRTTPAQWVERDSMLEMENELGMAAIGLSATSHGLQLGKMLSADLLITGTFSIDVGRGSLLTVDVIDAHTADVVTRFSHRMPPAAGKPLPLGPEQVAVVARMTAEALALAAAIVDENKDKYTIAPLFLRNTTVGSERFDFLENKLFASLETTLEPRQRVLRFPRAGDATGEASLVISGLTNVDVDNWANIADLYIWGSYRELESGGIPFPDVPIELEVSLWQGKDEPEVVTTTLTLNTIESAINELTEVIVAKASAGDHQRASELALDVRRHIATFLMDRAGEVELYERLPEPQYLRKWQLRSSILEVAAFFDPANAEIQRQWLVERWNATVCFPSHGSRWTGWHFRQRWEQMNEWHRHVERFGIESLKEIPGNRNTWAKFRAIIGANYSENVYAINAYVTFPIAFADAISRRTHALPHDITDMARAEWLDYWRRRSYDNINRVARDAPDFITVSLLNVYTDLLRFPPVMRRELFETVWKMSGELTTTDNNLAYIEEYMNNTYRVLGETGRLERLKEEYPGPRVVEQQVIANYHEQRRAQLEYVEKNRQPRPPRPGEIHSDVNNVETDPQSSGRSGNRITELFYTANHLWMGIRGEKIDETTLASYHPGSLEIRRWPGTTLDDRGQISAFTELNGIIWAGTQKHGLIGVNPSTNQTFRFGSQHGLPTEMITACAVANGRLFVAGGSSEEGRIGYRELGGTGWVMISPPEHGMRLIRSMAAWQNKVLIVDRRVENKKVIFRYMLYDIDSGKWQPFNERFPGSPPGARGIFADEHGYWVKGGTQLFFFDHDGNPGELVCQIPHVIRSWCHDGDFVWLSGFERVTIEGTDRPGEQPIVYLVHKPSRSLVTSMRIPRNGMAIAIAVSRATLWVSIQCSLGHDTGLIEIDKAPFLAKFSEGGR